MLPWLPRIRLLNGLPTGSSRGLQLAALGLLVLGASSVAGAIALDTDMAEHGTWQLTRTADPMQGGSIAMASVSAGGADVLVRCWTKSGEIDLRILLAPGSGRVASNQVSVGFDERLDADRTWRLSPNGLALVVPFAQRSNMLRRLQGASRMRLLVQTGLQTEAGASSEQIQLDIPLGGSSRAIRAVLQACS